MVISKGDFIEIDFIGKTQEGDIFDTTIPEEAKKINIKLNEKPFVICIGQKMLLQAIDDFLIGKELGSYTLNLTPKEAFGERKKELIKTMPMSVFNSSEQRPYVGMVFSFDNMLGKITAVSGGRVVVDFNNLLAGKNIIYELKAKKKITNENEKIKALINYFFNKDFEFKLENKKLIIKAEKGYDKFILFFKDKFKDMLGLDLEIEEIKNKEEKE